MYICHIEIDFDPEKTASNLRKHRVSFAHAEHVLRDLHGLDTHTPDKKRTNHQLSIRT